MTDLSAYIAAAEAGARPEVDWNEVTWSAARPALAWLRLAPDGAIPDHVRRLCAEDVETLSAKMVAAFVLPDGRLAWSSHLLSTAFNAISIAEAGPPESLLHAVWELFRDRELDKLIFNFCQAIGIELLSKRSIYRGWNLLWMLDSKIPSQVCLRFWTLALRPELWSADLERETQEILSEHGLA
jgi:hypothetical protein